MSEPAQPPVKLLLVDDVEPNLIALEALLAAPGIELLKAQSGDEALELAWDHEVALALLDVQMPGMDGFQLAELLRGVERTRRMPIIFVTAQPENRLHVFKGYEAGAVDVLFKPLEPHILRSKVGVFVELEQQRHLLAKQLEMLKQTVRLNETYAAILGHDLRNPLSVITSSVHLLKLRSDPAIAKSVTRIENNAQRMARLIDDLLDYSRSRTTGLPVNPQPMDVAVLVRKLKLDYDATERGTRLQISISGSGEGIWDSTRLQQLLTNLLDNAFHHGKPDGKVRLAIDGSDPSLMVFTLHNDGAVPEDQQQRLFEPFRGGTHSARSSGLGLGLYIVRQIARAHGGEVKVESSPELGTTFSVKIPRKK